MNFITFELVIHEFTFRTMKNKHVYVELICGAHLQQLDQSYDSEHKETLGHSENQETYENQEKSETEDNDNKKRCHSHSLHVHSHSG